MDIAEQIIERWLSRGRSMLYHAVLPASFLGEALNTAMKDQSLLCKGKPVWFRGIGQDEFGYMLYDPVQKKLVRSRDVVFEEDLTLKDVEKAERETIPQHNDDLIDLDLGLGDNTSRPRWINRVVLGLAASHDLEVWEQMMSRQLFFMVIWIKEIYMEQPEGFQVKRKEDYVCRLQKSLYGLKQAPRQWYKKFELVIRKARLSKAIFRSLFVHFQKFGNDELYSSWGAVSWQSRLQKCVALSTTEAEYMAATEACKELLWLKRFLQELGFKQQRYAVLCDNQNAIEDGMFELNKVHTDDNASDMLTKAVAREKLKVCCSIAGMANSSS
ncbi:retrovirus-related pol polyprotein from transposon TNT 1-94 [Tanacetum coccineum]